MNSRLRRHLLLLRNQPYAIAPLTADHNVGIVASHSIKEIVKPGLCSKTMLP
jgi:hypothetical protein